MKKLRNCFAALILISGMMILLSSCQALSEFEQLGFMGWLELGDPPFTSSTPTATGEVTSAVPSLIPTDTPTQEPAPETDDVLTSLPSVPTSHTMAEVLSALESKKLGGSPFMISYIGSPSIFTGIEAGKIMETFNGLEAKYNLNSTLFNQRTEDELAGLLSSNEYFADLILLPLDDAVKYAEEGKLLPINTEDLSFDIDGAYYKTAASFYSDEEGNPYFIIPSVSTPYENSIVIYCNTDLLARGADEDNIVSFVKNGKWDIDLFCKYIRLAEEKLTDEYVICDTALTQDTVTSLFCGGLKEGNVLEMSKFAANSFRFSDKTTAIQDFFEGKTLFYIGHTADLRSFRESGDSYALLPIPKKTESTDYTVYYDGSEVYVFAVPSTAVNHNSALLLIDALAICGRFEPRYNFIESMYSYYIRQRDSIIYTGVSRHDGIIPGCETAEKTPETEEPPTTEQPNTTEEPDNGDI